METFVRNHAEQITGIICGFDRLVFRGFLRSLSYVEGMMKYMAIAGVLLKDFASHALSMASVEDKTPLGKMADPLCQPTKCKGKRVRALNPLSPEDASLLEAIARGEYAINGFRNRDIQSILFADQLLDQTKKRSIAAKVTRKIRMLRAHGLVRKITHTHRYTLTDNGRRAVAALIADRNADVDSLAKLAA